MFQNVWDATFPGIYRKFPVPRKFHSVTQTSIKFNSIQKRDRNVLQIPPLSSSSSRVLCPKFCFYTQLCQIQFVLIETGFHTGSVINYDLMLYHRCLWGMISRPRAKLPDVVDHRKQKGMKKCKKGCVVCSYLKLKKRTTEWVKISKMFNCSTSEIV